MTPPAFAGKNAIDVHSHVYLPRYVEGARHEDDESDWRSTALNTWPGVYLGEACFIALWP